MGLGRGEPKRDVAEPLQVGLRLDTQRTFSMVKETMTKEVWGLPFSSLGPSATSFMNEYRFPTNGILVRRPLVMPAGITHIAGRWQGTENKHGLWRQP